MNKIANYLRDYNLWRRGSEIVEQPNPYELGVMIDKAIARLEELETITDEKVERVARVLHGRYKGALTIEQPHAYSAPSINNFNGAAKEALEAAIGGGDE